MRKGLTAGDELQELDEEALCCRIDAARDGVLIGEFCDSLTGVHMNLLVCPAAAHTAFYRRVPVTGSRPVRTVAFKSCRRPSRPAKELGEGVSRTKRETPVERLQVV
jgi:hypothetical protein